MERTLQPIRRDAQRNEPSVSAEHDDRASRVSLYRERSRDELGVRGSPTVRSGDQHDSATDQRNDRGFVICPREVMLTAGAVLMTAGMLLAALAGFVGCDCGF